MRTFRPPCNDGALICSIPVVIVTRSDRFRLAGATMLLDSVLGV